MSRRAALPLAVAVLAGLALPAQAASPSLITIEDDAFDPTPAEKVLDAEGFAWEWGAGGVGTSNQHSVVQDRGLFKSGPPSTNDGFQVQASAGSFPYHCRIHGEAMTGVVRVRPDVILHDAVNGDMTVRWATARETGNRFDLRLSFNGTPVGTIRRDDRRKEVDVFNSDPGTYEFQARSKLRSDGRKRSGWSPSSHPVVVTG